MSISPLDVGVVNQSATITFAIINAFPSVSLQNIQWMFNNTVIRSSPRYMFSSSRLSLTIFNLQHSDEGYYSMMATNEAGSNTSSVFLEIEGIYFHCMYTLILSCT